MELQQVHQGQRAALNISVNHNLINRGDWLIDAAISAGPMDAAEALKLLVEAADNFAGITDAGVPALDAAPDWLARAPVHRLPLFTAAAGVHAVLSGGGDF